jgi:hypothetical protein
MGVAASMQLIETARGGAGSFKIGKNRWRNCVVAVTW